jgi:transcription antitermination factor NusG
VENEAWYAVWTRSRHEHVVERGLKGKGLTVFLPTVHHPSRRTDRRKLLDCPLFPGYLFFYGAGDSSTQLSVLQTSGVVRILGEHTNGFTSVPEEQVEAIRKLTCSGLVFAAVPYLRLGERVRIKDGPLAGVEGIIQEFNARKSRVVVSVDLLQRSVAVELEGWRLERA